MQSAFQLDVNYQRACDSLEGAPAVVAIGNFDGVHLGHQAVLGDTVKQSKSEHLAAVVLTFEPHPTVAVGRASPSCLTRLDRKLELIQRIDPNLRVIVKNFDSSFASLSPEQFASTVLHERLNARVVRVGANFRFGANRSGDLRVLTALGNQYGFQVQPTAFVADSTERLSSTRARAAIAAGDLALAAAILSRPHSISATVVRGQQVARRLGYPTANLRWIQEACPPHGVYAVVVDLLDPPKVNSNQTSSNFASPRGVIHGSLTELSQHCVRATRLARGVCSIGVRPTLDAGFAVEVHLFDMQRDLYGAQLRVHFVQYLRRELKLSGINALKRQIERDMIQARQVVADIEPDPKAAGAWF